MYRYLGFSAAKTIDLSYYTLKIYLMQICFILAQILNAFKLNKIKNKSGDNKLFALDYPKMLWEQ